MDSSLVHFAQIKINDEGFVFFDAGLGEDFAGSAGDETLAPELDAVTRKLFVTNAIGDSHVATIGDGVAALDDLPGGMLPRVLCFFARMPADGGRIKKNFGP